METSASVRLRAAMGIQTLEVRPAYAMKGLSEDQWNHLNSVEEEEGSTYVST